MTGLFDKPLPPMSGKFAHVALEQGIDLAPAGLTYAVPASMAEVAVGERVVVPLGRGNKTVPGYVMELVDRCDLPNVKAIQKRDASGVRLPGDLVELARWIAGYYCCPIGMVLATMLPAAVKRGTGRVVELRVGLPEPAATDAGETGAAAAAPDAAMPKPVKLTALQKRVLAVADERRGKGQRWTLMRELADAAGARSVSPVKQLVDKGLLAVQEQEGFRGTARNDEEAGGSEEPDRAWTLTGSQRRAVERLASHVGNGFSVHLLHGVTGSGKTEVYLRVIEQVLARGEERGAIVLVPEIALTPQTVGRFAARFGRGGAGVAVLHSGLTGAQRHEQWRRIRGGEARIVVGARSAVFAPLPRVGVIIVDEEHENSYKQDQLPRYHARDVAIKRGQLLGIPVLLGSATPSLESWHNATDASGGGGGRYQLLSLPERVAGLAMPRVEVVDLREERRRRAREGDRGVHLLSMKLEEELARTLREGGQALLLLNRRGYASYIACPDARCGWMMRCDYCDATMVYHLDKTLPTGGVVRCHHCGAEQRLARACPTCGKKVTVFGLGTQRVEEELARKWPGVRMARMDSDTMRTGRDYHEALERFRRGEIDVLLGTQMIAKGLDFPNVRLVGVISADTALHMPDFRASERTFQLVAQVTGRAGRGESSQGSRVLVQTMSPEDPAITLAAAHDYEGFAARELALRASAGLPPATRMARIVVRDEDLAACTESARALAEQLREADAALGTGVRIRPPSPCPIARVAGHHRAQVELIAARAGAIQKLLTQLRNQRQLRSDAHTAVDVDPVALL